MNRYKFTCTNISHHQDYKVTVEVAGDLNLTDLLVEIESFIRACGYRPEGQLVFDEESE